MKRTTKSGRKKARSERIDEIQWRSYSERQIHSSDVRKRQNDRKGKQSRRELTKCSELPSLEERKQVRRELTKYSGKATANDSDVAKKRNDRERRRKKRTDIRKTKNDRESKQTTKSGR